MRRNWWKWLKYGAVGVASFVGVAMICFRKSQNNVKTVDTKKGKSNCSKYCCCIVACVWVLVSGIILFVFNKHAPNLLSAVLMFCLGALCALVFMCVLADCDKKKKTDCLDCALVWGGLVISAALILCLYIPSVKSKLCKTLNLEGVNLGDVGTVIAAVGALITARFIYRQLQDNKRQFSLTSVQDAFFSLYNKIEFKENDITKVVPLLDLLVLNLHDDTLIKDNAAYYLNLVVIRFKGDLLKKYCKAKFCEKLTDTEFFKYKKTWKELRDCYNKLYKQK